MPKFYFNNSSLPILACSKQYEYRVIRGLAPPPGGNKYTTAGVVFHRVMQTIGPGSNYTLTAAMTPDKLPDFFRKVPIVQQLQIAQTAEQLYTAEPHLFTTPHVRELYFEYELPDLPGVIWCGTIDLLTLADNGWVVITDYKTTAKPIDGQLVTSYALTSQRPFYLAGVCALASLHPEALPAEMIDPILSLKLAFRYCFVNVEKNQYVLQQPQPISEPEMDMFIRLFDEKARYAAALHEAPDLAVKEGMLSGICWKCPYQQLCLAQDEEAAASQWPYGTKPYTGRHDEQL